MTITKKCNKIVFSIILIFTLIIGAILMSGCSLVIAMFGSKYYIDKVIYTNDYQKYIAGRTVVDSLEASNYTFESGPQNGFWILKTNKTNTYDMVFTTVPVEYDDSGSVATGQSANVGMSADVPYYTMSDDGSNVIFDNSHIFSGMWDYYKPGGETDCDSRECLGDYNDIDGCMMCWGSSDAWITDSQKTDEEVLAYMGVCACCNYVEEIVNDDGTYSYTVINNCSCVGKFYHDGTWQVVNQKWNAGTSVAVNFNELIIDGFDFSYLYNFLKDFDYSALYTNWESFYNLGDFSHMFSDLPVKKISIKNISGLGDKAVDLSSMFENCTNLETVEFGNLFENCKPTNISKMFYNCPKIKDIDLTTLDTSLVTDMSDMFNLGYANLISVKERDAIINDYIKTVVVPNSEYDPSEVYDIKTLAVKTEMDENYLKVMLAVEGKLGLPFAYTELTKARFQKDLTELYVALQEDPTALGMAAGTYNVGDMVDLIENMASGYGIEAVYDAEMYGIKNRDEYVLYFLNNFLLVLSDWEEKGTPQTMEYFIDKLGFETKENLIFNVVDTTHLEIPMTYEEVVFVSTGYSMAEVIIAANSDPSQFGLSPKEDGSLYTEEDVYDYIDAAFSGSNIVIVTDEEFEDYYKEEGLASGTLTLGGQNSLFVINSAANVDRMFGRNRTFSKIITPNQIGDGVEIILSTTYSPDGHKTVTKITSNDANKTFMYKELTTYADPPKKTPISMTTLIIIGAIFVVVVSAGCIIGISIKNKKNGY